MTENTIERIVEICKQKNIPVSRVERDLGFGNGSLNPEKASDIKATRLFRVLNYLGVSFQEFYGISPAPFNEEEIPATYDDGDDELINYIVSVLKDLPVEYKIRAANVAQDLKSELQAQDTLKESP